MPYKSGQPPFFWEFGMQSHPHLRLIIVAALGLLVVQLPACGGGNDDGGGNTGGGGDNDFTTHTDTDNVTGNGGDTGNNGAGGDGDNGTGGDTTDPCKGNQSCSGYCIPASASCCPGSNPDATYCKTGTCIESSSYADGYACCDPGYKGCNGKCIASSSTCPGPAGASCTSDYQCQSGLYCGSGKCIAGCSSDSQCSGNLVICKNHACAHVQCTYNGDCSGCSRCVSNSCETCIIGAMGICTC